MYERKDIPSLNPEQYAGTPKWGVWNLTFDTWALPGIDSWHGTRDAAQRECDAWAKANGCMYEPREKRA